MYVRVQKIKLTFLFVLKKLHDSNDFVTTSKYTVFLFICCVRVGYNNMHLFVYIMQYNLICIRMNKFNLTSLFFKISTFKRYVTARYVVFLVFLHYVQVTHNNINSYTCIHNRICFFAYAEMKSYLTSFFVL